MELHLKDSGCAKCGLVLLVAFLYFIAMPICAQPVARSNPLNSDPLVKEAFQHFYELDYNGAVERLERVHSAHAGDPQGAALLLDALIFRELYRLDLLDTTFYANDGFLTGKHPTPEDPQVRSRIFAVYDEAVNGATQRLEKNPNDVDALVTRGWSKSLKAVYLAMVPRSFGAGMRLAIQAKDDSKRALELDPQYVDAKLVYGVYEYVVGALPWEFKLLIGFMGMTGSKEKGLALLYDDGARGTVTALEARTAIALFLRREAKYKEAIVIVQAMRRQYPRDFLFCLEEANLRKDAGEGMAAVDAYRELLREAAQPGYFYEAHLDLAYFGLGESLRGQRHFDEAADAYEKAALAPTVGAELKRRALVAAGMSRDLSGERKLAVRDYQMAIDAGEDTTQGELARQYLHKAYHEK
jgi:tetratricopeptide (TPR) repeat protein